MVLATRAIRDVFQPDVVIGAFEQTGITAKGVSHKAITMLAPNLSETHGKEFEEATLQGPLIGISLDPVPVLPENLGLLSLGARELALSQYTTALTAWRAKAVEARALETSGLMAHARLVAVTVQAARRATLCHKAHAPRQSIKLAASSRASIVVKRSIEAAEVAKATEKSPEQQARNIMGKDLKRIAKDLFSIDNLIAPRATDFVSLQASRTKCVSVCQALGLGDFVKGLKKVDVLRFCVFLCREALRDAKMSARLNHAVQTKAVLDVMAQDELKSNFSQHTSDQTSVSDGAAEELGRFDADVREQDSDQDEVGEHLAVTDGISPADGTDSIAKPVSLAVRSIRQLTLNHSQPLHTQQLWSSYNSSTASAERIFNRIDGNLPPTKPYDYDSKSKT